MMFFVLLLLPSFVFLVHLPSNADLSAFQRIKNVPKIQRIYIYCESNKIQIEMNRQHNQKWTKNTTWKRTWKQMKMLFVFFFLLFSFLRTNNKQTFKSKHFHWISCELWILNIQTNSFIRSIRKLKDILAYLVFFLSDFT